MDKPSWASRPKSRNLTSPCSGTTSRTTSTPEMKRRTDGPRGQHRSSVYLVCELKGRRVSSARIRLNVHIGSPGAATSLERVLDSRSVASAEGHQRGDAPCSSIISNHFALLSGRANKVSTAPSDKPTNRESRGNVDHTALTLLRSCHGHTGVPGRGPLTFATRLRSEREAEEHGVFFTVRCGRYTWTRFLQRVL